MAYDGFTEYYNATHAVFPKRTEEATDSLREQEITITMADVEDIKDVLSLINDGYKKLDQTGEEVSELQDSMISDAYDRIEKVINRISKKPPANTAGGFSRGIK